jgi:triosephosphate isomerase
MNKFIVFNFKMAPASLKEVKEIFQIFKKFLQKIKPNKIIIAPPSIYLTEASDIFQKECVLGAQDVFWFNRNSATGEVSPKMLKSLGVEYIIVGHSERREYFNETNEIINSKIKACLSNNLTPVLCVGEKNRKKGDSSSSFRIKKILFEQLNYALRGIILEKSADLIIAYEPVWAISANQPKELENPKETEKTISLIRFWLARRFSEKIAKNIRILYGGSVDSQNISSFLSLKEINGVLVGRASTNKMELTKLLKKIIKK